MALQPSPPTLSARPPPAHHQSDQPARDLQLGSWSCAISWRRVLGERLRVVLSGMVAGDPYQGGATWAVLQYVFGLQALGHDVWLVEPVAEPSRETTEYFASVVEA